MAINALWVNLLCDSYTACNSDGTTFDGIAPFTTPGDLSTPNPAYFDRAEEMLQAAAAKNMVVLLDPIETGGWLSVLDDNGEAKARAYGRFLGTRFKDQPNIIWMSGNDFQSWRDPSQNKLVRAVMRGLAETDPNHIQTIELDYYVSASLEDAALRPLLGLDAVYTYRPTYAEELTEYKRAAFAPTFLVEANYEFEHNGGTDGGTTQNLRRQEWWTATSGTTGQLYGSAYSWRLQGDWADNLDTVGIQQLSYVKQLLEPRKWYDLVPDRAHQVLTKGFGKFSKDDPIPDDTYATAALTTRRQPAARLPADGAQGDDRHEQVLRHRDGELVRSEQRDDHGHRQLRQHRHAGLHAARQQRRRRRRLGAAGREGIKLFPSPTPTVMARECGPPSLVLHS